MRLLVSLAISLLSAAANAQTYNITGTLKGLAGEDYSISGTATLDNGAWTISGDLKSTTPPQQCRTITAPNGNLTDGSGAVWNWGPITGSGNNWSVMRNGQTTAWVGRPTEGVAAVTMSVVNGTAYNHHFSGEWRRWTPQGWVVEANAPAGC